MNAKSSAIVAKPGIGQTVILSTASKIDGQNEHAAIITKVIDDDLVNVTVLPSAGSPYPIVSVYHERHSAAAALSWRFRPRDRL